jgi:hypothetical protein
MRRLKIFRQVRVDHRARSGQFAFHVRVRECAERSRVYDGRSALERVHYVVPLDRQEVRAEPVRAGLADSSHSRPVERGMSRGHTP